MTSEQTFSQIETEGPLWASYQYSGEKSSRMKITTDSTSNIDVYVLRGATSDPNNFVYDMNMLAVNGTVTIDSNELGLDSDEGYSFAIYVNAVNETANQLLNATVNITLTVYDTALAMKVGSMIAVTLFAIFASF